MDEPSFERAYLAVLQNIEAAILTVYQQRPALADLQVDAALEAAVRALEAQAAGRAVRLPNGEAARAVYAAVMRVIEWRLGRTALPREGSVEGEAAGALRVDKPITFDEAVACLKRLRRSLQYWNRESGSQGYLNYIRRFVL